MAKIDFDYIVNKFGILFFKLKKKKILKVLIFCPQRTFSNYFESFLLKNFYVEIINSTDNIKKYQNPLHKHSISTSPILKEQFNNSDYIIFLLYKNSSNWIDSLNRNDQDFFDQFLYFHKIKIERNDRLSLIEFHKNWYKNWIDNIKNFSNVEFINHEQTFSLKNNLSLFNYLKSKYPIISKRKMKLPINIRRSDSFNINNYKKKNNKFDEYSKFFKII
tara:strand:- start:4794 stop:5450 length:657 start_codon:yes stop_codon:yes gene_type:complete